MAKLEMKVNQKILVVNVLESGYAVHSFQLTDKGYVSKNAKMISFDKSDKMILKNILKIENEFSKILVEANDNPDEAAMLERLVERIFLPSFTDKIVYVQKDDENLNPGKCMIETGKWIADKKSLNTFILPSSTREYMVFTEIHGIYGIFLKAELGVLLPFEASGMLHKTSNVKFFLGYFNCDEDDEKTPVILQRLTLPPNFHGYKFTLTVDENNMPECIVEGTMLQEIAALPLFLNMFCFSKIPVIGFCSNFSVIFIHQDNEIGYQFFDGWDGLSGKELFISFADKKPKFCEDALKDHSKKASSVISDLIRIMAMPKDEIEESVLWKFSIVKDSGNPVLIEFDNFDGTRKAASPAFLMALLLKEHLKAIKNEIGEKPKKLGFWFLNRHSDAENERIKAGVDEACKLLKIESMFID
uniref:Uncharacterized protein n=1 Tax=Panagrolaimus superbus TaxID=310955 RepID=A0A914XUA1_9BILA